MGDGSLLVVLGSGSSVGIGDGALLEALGSGSAASGDGLLLVPLGAGSMGSGTELVLAAVPSALDTGTLVPVGDEGALDELLLAATDALGEVVTDGGAALVVGAAVLDAGTEGAPTWVFNASESLDFSSPQLSPAVITNGAMTEQKAQ